MKRYGEKYSFSELQMLIVLAPFELSKRNEKLLGGSFLASACWIVDSALALLFKDPVLESGNSRLLIHPCGVEGAHDFFGGTSSNTDSIRQAKVMGNRGKPRYPLLPLKQTNKQKRRWKPELKQNLIYQRK